MKPAEDGDGVIVRCYEALNRRGPVDIRIPGVKAAAETNLMEDNETIPQASHGCLRFEVEPFGIRTFRARVAATATARPSPP